MLHVHVIIKNRLKSIQYRPALIDGFRPDGAQPRTPTAVDLSLSTSVTTIERDLLRLHDQLVDRILIHSQPGKHAHHRTRPHADLPTSRWPDGPYAGWCAAP